MSNHLNTICSSFYSVTTTTKSKTDYSCAAVVTWSPHFFFISSFLSLLNAPCLFTHRHTHVYTHTHTHWSVEFKAVDSDVCLTWVYSQIYHLLSIHIQLCYLPSLSLYVFIWKRKIGTMHNVSKCKVLWLQLLLL